MLKLAIVANNQKKWKSWDSKIQELKDWYTDLEVTLIHTDFKEIPFNPAVPGQVDVFWYIKNLIPLAKGADIIVLSMPVKQWKGGETTGRWTNGKPHMIAIGADETGKYYFNNKLFPGGRWFNLARHEISHAKYKILGLVDNTHYWWELGQFENSRKELMQKPVSTLQHLVLAMQLKGTKEFAGTANNPVILKWAKELGIPYTSDSTAWCSLYVNYICMKAGLPYTKKLNARSWLDVGKKVTVPRAGDVCIFWRNHKDSWEGHVGFYMVGNDKQIAVLGGNQDNEVSIKFYDASKLLGFRRLI